MKTVDFLEDFLDPIGIDWNKDGKWIENGVMFFGGGISRMPRQVSYATSVELISHEIAHLIEIDDNRALDPYGWGFQYGTFLSHNPFGREDFFEYKRNIHVLRELRVTAIQLQICEYLEYKLDISSCIQTFLEFIPGFDCHVPGNSKEEKLRWSLEFVENLVNQESYTLPEILSEFNRKKCLILKYCSPYDI